MGDVVAIAVHRQDTPSPLGPRRLIAILAKGMVLLIAGLVLFDVVVMTLGFACHGAFLGMGPDSAYIGAAPGIRGVVAFGSLPILTRLAYAATQLLDTVPVAIALYELRALLHLYAAGAFFSVEGPAHMDRAGAWLIAATLAPAFGHTLVVLAGHGVDEAWLHASSLETLVAAALFVTLARVMSIGHDIECDRDGFV